MSGTAAKTTQAKSKSQTSGSFFGGGPDRAATPFFSAAVPRLQRKCTSCEAEAARQFQPKLTVGEPDDRFEQEADRVADQVMRMPEPTVHRQSEPEDEADKVVQTKPEITPFIQRQTEDVEMEEILQAKEAPGSTGEVTLDVQARINAMQGGGKPLLDSTRAFFEPRFGADFSGVRVHDDANAADAARSVNARAFTVGRDIVFGAGQSAPRTTQGRRLMAHELTHVVQQQGHELQPAQTRGDEAHGNTASERDAVLMRAAGTRGAGIGASGVRSHGSMRRGLRQAGVPRQNAGVRGNLEKGRLNFLYATAPLLLKRDKKQDDSGDADPEMEPEDAVLDPAASTLLQEFREAGRKRAVELLPRVAAHPELNTIVAQLDAEGLLEPVFRKLGPNAWQAPNRDPVLRILRARAPAANAATIRAQLGKGILKGGLTVSGEEARWVYEVLRAMDPEARREFFTSDMDAAAFEWFDEHRRLRARLANAIEFIPEDIETLTTELARAELWEQPGSDPALRVMLWMARHHASESAVTDEIAPRWETHGGLLREFGFLPDGGMSGDVPRDTPRGFGISLNAVGKLTFEKGGVFALAARMSVRRWGKKNLQQVRGMPIEKLQKVFGKSLLGLRLDGLENEELTASIGLDVNPRMGELRVLVTDAVFPAASWGGEADGAMLSVTGRNLAVDHVEFAASWPPSKKQLGTTVMSVDVGTLSADSVVVTRAGVEAGRLENLEVTGLGFSLDLGQLEEGERISVLRMVRFINEEFAKLAPIVPAAVGVLVASVKSDADKSPGEYLSELGTALTSELGNQLLLQTTGQARITADAVSIDGVGRGSLDTGFELAVHAGWRALATMRMRELQDQGILSTADGLQLAAIRHALDIPDRIQAEAALKTLKLSSDDLVVEVTTQGLRLGDFSFPAAPVDVEDLQNAGPAKVTVTMPGVASKDEKAQPKDVAFIATLSSPLTTEIPKESTTRVDEVTAIAGPLTLEGISGTATVLRDGRIDVDATIGGADFQYFDWGAVQIHALGGHATTIKIAGMVEKDDTGFSIAGDTPIEVDVTQVTADQLNVVFTGVVDATLMNPVLNGLHVVLASGSWPTLRVDSGVLTGFESLVSRVIHSTSSEPIEFTGFNTMRAMIDLGVAPFSFDQLITGNIDTELYGRKLVVKRFAGAVSGLLTGDPSGWISVDPSAPIVVGPLELKLNPLSDQFGWVDLGWDSLTLSPDAGFRVSWTPVEDRADPDAPPAALKVTLEALSAATATATGLWLSTDLVGAPIDVWMSAFGEATIYELRIPSLTVEVSEDELKVDGSIISEALEAHGLVAQLGERLRLEFAADSKRLRFDAFSDGPHRFALDDLVVSGGLVVVKGGRPLRWWRVEVSGDVTGTIGAEGIRATVEGTKVGFEFPTHTGEPSEAGVAPEPTPEPDAVRDVDVDMDVDDIDFDTDANTAPARVDRDQALDPDADTDVTDTDVDVDQDVPVEMEFDLEPPEDRLAHQIDLGRLDLHATKQDMAFIVGPGTYTVPGIHLEFEELQATAVLGRPWDRPGKLSRIQLDEGAPAQGLPIVKLTDINIAGARFTIDDVSSWVGKAELAELDPAQLQDLARGVSGSIAFRAILVRGVSEVRGFDAFDIDTAVRRGNLDGHIHGPDLAVPVENPLAPGRPPIWVNVPDWLPFQGQLMFGDANGHSSLELFRAYASLPLVGWRVLPLGVSVYWPPTDPVVVDVPTFLNPMVTALENLHLDLNVKLTDQVPLPGNNHLFLAHGSTMTLEAFPSSPAQSDVHTVVVTVDTRAARMLLMNVADVEISGVKLAKGIKAQVQHDGLAIKQLSGVVEEGHIDAATIGIIASDE